MTASRQTGQRRARRIVWPSVGVVSAALVWVVVWANGPARRVGQLTILRSGGPPAVLTLWEARALIASGLISGRSHRVGFGGKVVTVHTRQRGSDVGPVFVSPDGSQAWVSGTYHGTVDHGLLVDVATGAMQRTDSRADAYERAGWHRRFWRTEFELLSTAEVLAVTREQSPDRYKLALDELTARGFVAGDWPAFTAALLDPSFPSTYRPGLAYAVTPAGGVDYDERIDFVGGWLDDPEPKVRLCSAWALAVMAIDTNFGRPAFDPAAVWQAGRGEQDRVIVEARTWWQHRQAASTRKSRPTTAPVLDAGR